MKYLVFLVCFAFGSLFQFLYTKSIGKTFFFQNANETVNIYGAFWNFIGETILFFILGIALFFIFSEKWEKDEEKVNSFSLADFTHWINIFFWKYLYYIGFCLFYLSFYFVLSYFSLSFQYFILLVNIFVGILFFTNERFYIFRDLIKISTILSSLYFIGFYIITFTQPTVLYTWIDFINSLLILGFFILNIYFDKKFLKKHESDTWLTIYFFLYLYLFISFYLFLSLSSLSFIFSLTGALFTFFLFYYVPLFSLFKKNTIPLRYLSLFTSYTSLFFSWSYLYTEFNFVVFFIFIGLSIFNMYIHMKFQNYVSFTAGILWTLSALYIGYFQFFFVILNGYSSLLFLSFLVIVGCVITSYSIKFYHKMDYIILYICWFGWHFYGLFYYFYAAWFDILTFWIILFLESVIVFATYYKINLLFPHEEEEQEQSQSSHDHHSHH